MNKTKEFMFLGRNVIENMNKSKEFMFTDQNVVENMDNQQISMFSACRNTPRRHYCCKLVRYLI